MNVVNDIVRKMRTSMNTLNGMVTVSRERIARGGDAAETLKGIAAGLDMVAEESERMIGYLNDLNQLEASKSEEVKSENLVSGRFADRHFLVVDDVPGNALVVAEMLSLCGGVVVTASNGRSAVNAFQRSDLGAFDCILMDLRMPEMDGFAATKAIRATDRADAKTVPIIAMSADTFSEDRGKSAEVGMNACITKPVRLKDLSAILEPLFASLG